MNDSGYKGLKAGAIASGLFVAAISFLALFGVAAFFIAASEGGPRNLDRENVRLVLSLILSALTASWLGWRTKRFFDRPAGRS